MTNQQCQLCIHKSNLEKSPKVVLSKEVSDKIHNLCYLNINIYVIYVCEATCINIKTLSKNIYMYHFSILELCTFVKYNGNGTPTRENYILIMYKVNMYLPHRQKRVFSMEGCIHIEKQ